MKHLCIVLIIAAGLAGCRNGPNNARDTTGIGSEGTAGGTLMRPSDTAGKYPGNAGGAARPMTPADSALVDSARRYKKTYSR